MTALNNLFTEEIAGTIVLVSFDYNTQTFKVVNKQTEDILIDGDDISVNAFLERMELVCFHQDTWQMIQ